MTPFIGPNRWLIATITALLLFRSSASAGQTGHDFKQFADSIHEQCDPNWPGGYAFEVLEHGKVVLTEAHGYARAPWEPRSPAVRWSVDKPMAIASVSKAVTAVALLRLWEEQDKKFSLDDPFWPHIQRLCPRADRGVQRVTIRQLLQQKSGFKRIDDCVSPRTLDALLVQPLEHDPGSTYRYDNNNFYIARLVLEQLSGDSYTPYVREHVLKPMGITGMQTRSDPDEPTCGYGKPGTKWMGYPFEWNCDASAGPSGWYASVSDLGRFLTGLRNHVVLTAATTDMMEDQLLGWDSKTPGLEKNGGWWWTEGLPPFRTGACRTSIFHFPDDVDAVIFINCDTPRPPEQILGSAWERSRTPASATPASHP